MQPHDFQDMFRGSSFGTCCVVAKLIVNENEDDLFILKDFLKP